MADAEKAEGSFLGIPMASRGSGGQLGAENAKAMILVGAAQVFAEQGARSVSVENLLTAAGVSRRTFYRFYKGKEAVMEALYTMGTNALLSASRCPTRGSESTSETLQRCIDAHLANAMSLGRLMYVLGGEAQNQESSLYAHRLATQEAIVELLIASAQEEGLDVDPFVFRTLILGLEALTRIVLEEGDEGRAVSTESVERARQVMRRMGTATLFGHGAGITELPPAPT